MDKSFWAAIKLLLHPRAITIFDLESLSQSVKTNIREILESKKLDEITHLSLSLLKPIAKIEGLYNYTISKDSIERQIMLQKEIIRRLLAGGHAEIAEMCASVLIRMSYYFITLYLLSSGISKSSLEFIKINFEDGVLRTLMSIFEDPEFVKIARSLSLEKDLEFSLKALMQLIKSTINLLPDSSRKRITSELCEFLEYSQDLEALYKDLDKVLKSNVPERVKRRILENVIYLLGTVFRDELPHDGGRIKIILNFMKSIGDSARLLTPEFRDIIWDSINVLANTISKTCEGKIEEAVDQLSKFGEQVLRERYLAISMSERVAMKIPGDLRALLPPIIVAPINLIDIHQYINLTYLVNEAIDSLIDTSNELKLILNMLAVLSDKQLTDLLIKVHEDPLASLALSFLIGSVSSWLADLAIYYSAPRTESRRALLDRILRALIGYLRVVYERTESLSKIWSEPEYLRKIVFYHLYREYYFLSLRLFAIEDMKQDVPAAQELLSFSEKIAASLNRVYEFPREKKEEQVDEFII